MPKSEGENKPTRFIGFRSPTYTVVPDELFDELLADLSGAETKVLLYIVRRTFGFKKESDDIALSQICHGISTRDGRVLDRGTGLSKSTVVVAVRGLVEKNIVLPTQNRSLERGDEPTTYRLNVFTRRTGSAPAAGSRTGVAGKVRWRSLQR